MKILYYEKQQCFSEGRLLESLVNLGLRVESLILDIAAHPLFNKAEIDLDHILRILRNESEMHRSGSRLIPFESMTDSLQSQLPGGKFFAQTAKVIHVLIQSRNLAAQADNCKYPSGISAYSFLELLAYAKGLDALEIGSIFVPAMPIISRQTQQAKLIESLYQICQPNVMPEVNGEEGITWVAAALLSVLGEFQIPSFRYIRSIGNLENINEMGNQPLKAVLGELDIAEDKEVVLIQTNIDDMNPQLLSYAITRLFEAGAIDVYQIPIQMKKNRSGIQLNVTARQRDEAKLANLILIETTTLGVNIRKLDHRYHAEISLQMIDTKFGRIPIKQKFVDGVLIQSRPEYEAAAKIASELKITMDEVYNEVVRQLKQN